MRSALLLSLLLAACAVPTGSEVEVCDGSWRDVDAQIVTPGGERPRSLAIECMRQVDDRRVRIGFFMPAGPSCYRLAEVRVAEAAEAVSITLMVGRHEDPAAGACPEQAVRAATEVDLQAPVADRVLLDGSAPSD